jgi:hypothetical protein
MLVRMPWWLVMLLFMLVGVGVCEGMGLPAAWYWIGAGLGLVAYAGWRRHGDRPIFYPSPVTLMGFRMLALGVAGGIIFKKLGWSSELGLALGLIAYAVWIVLHRAGRRESYIR